MGYKGLDAQDATLNPMQLHRKYAWAGGRCTACQSREPIIRIRSYREEADLIDNDPALAAVLAAANGGPLPQYHTTFGTYVPVSAVFACGGCRAELEKAAAHVPSHWIVEIDRGPDHRVGIDKAQFGYGGASSSSS